MKKLQIVGIDLGTTNSEIYKVENGVPVLVMGPNNTRVTSSSVVVDNVSSVDEVVFARGAKAINVLRNCHGNKIYEPKRILGRTFNDPYVRRDVHFWSFRLVEGDDGMPYYEVEGKGKKFQLSPVDVDAQILKTLKAYAKEGVENAVITVPAYFSESQREATKLAGEKAGFNVIKLIPEPIAAAIAYARSHDVKNHNILVYDLGGGTFDCCLIRCSNNHYEVKAKNGHSHLGGADFDNVIVKKICDEFNARYGIDLHANPKVMKELKEKATQAKIILSNVGQTTIQLESFEDNNGNVIPAFEREITQNEFHGLIEQKVDTTIAFVRNMLQELNMTIHNVDDVVCVGGSTYIPLVREKLREFFNGKEIDFKAVDIFEAVAQGAAIYADELMKGNDLIMDNTQTITETRPPQIFEIPYSIYFNVGKGYECMFEGAKKFGKREYYRSVSNYDVYYERDVSTVQIDLYRCRDGENYEIFGHTRFKLNEPIAKRVRHDDGPDVIMKFELDNHGKLKCTYKCTSNNQMVHEEYYCRGDELDDDEKSEDYYCRGDELDDDEKSEKVKKIVEYEEEAKGMLNELNEGDEEKREKILEFLEYLNDYAFEDSVEIINKEYEKMKA